MINEDQIRVMIKFMQRHGDLRRSGDVHSRQRIKTKWLELVGILNRIGEKKSLRQWSKVWSDTKYNTIKKYQRSMQGGPELTENDKIILGVLKNKPGRYRHKITDSDDPNISLELSNPSANMTNSCDNPIKEEVTRDHETSSQEQPRTITEQVFYVLPRTEKREDSLLSSASSSKSFADDKRSFDSVEKAKIDRIRSNSTDSVDKLSEIADKFYELERERERLAHEREMARIKQHSEFLSVMSRLVNVVESLAPSIKRYMDSNLNGDG